MSFGFSPSDIVALVAITTKAYRGWKSACGEYSEITGSLDSFLIVLERIEHEASKPNSVLLRTNSDRAELKDILSNSEPTVRELHAIVVRFKSLGSSREKNWDKLRLGVKNLDPLRVRLTQHTAAITAYLDAVGLGALGRIERDLNAIPKRIQRTIDGLAAEIRAGRREGTIMTTYSDDEKDVWKQFRRELIGDGMRSSFVHKYKPLIRKYLKELAERGELEELSPEYDTPPNESRFNDELAEDNASVKSRSSILDQEAQQVDFIGRYITPAKSAGQASALRANQRDEQSPSRSSQSSGDVAGSSPADLPATDALASVPSVHAECEFDMPSHIQGMMARYSDRSPHATPKDTDESHAVPDNEATKRHEADRRYSGASFVSEPIGLDSAESDSEMEPNLHSPIDEQVSSAGASIVNTRVEPELAPFPSDEHSNGPQEVERAMHATVEDADDSDASVCPNASKFRVADGSDNEEISSPWTKNVARCETTTSEDKLVEDGSGVMQSDDASSISASSNVGWKFETKSKRLLVRSDETLAVGYTGIRVARLKAPRDPCNEETFGRDRERLKPPGLNQYSRELGDGTPANVRSSFERRRLEMLTKSTEAILAPSSASSDWTYVSIVSAHAPSGSIPPGSIVERFEDVGRAFTPSADSDNVPRRKLRQLLCRYRTFPLCGSCGGQGTYPSRESYGRTQCEDCGGTGRADLLLPEEDIVSNDS